MPPPGYWTESSKLKNPDVSVVDDLSAAAERHGFKVPAGFSGTTLADALRRSLAGVPKDRMILREREAELLAVKIRMCLRLLGDAIMHLAVKSDKNLRHLNVQREGLYPIVDAGMSSKRERLFNSLLVQAFCAGPFIFRGGVLSGYKGFGKSQLVRNVVLAKQLVSWAALQDAEDVSSTISSKHMDSLAVRHVGIYVSNPALLKNLRHASPEALIAAGLHRVGLLEEPG